jgi:hypothetical protein
MLCLSQEVSLHCMDNFVASQKDVQQKVVNLQFIKNELILYRLINSCYR